MNLIGFESHIQNIFFQNIWSPPCLDKFHAVLPLAEICFELELLFVHFPCLLILIYKLQNVLLILGRNIILNMYEANAFISIGLLVQLTSLYSQLDY